MQLKSAGCCGESCDFTLRLLTCENSSGVHVWMQYEMMVNISYACMRPCVCACVERKRRFQRETMKAIERLKFRLEQYPLIIGYL